MPWPTLAAACWVARSRGRRGSPSGLRPAAMAPELTSTTSSPARCAPASASTSASSRAVSSPPAVVVSDEEPTLTTTRRRLMAGSPGALHGHAYRQPVADLGVDAPVGRHRAELDHGGQGLG